MRRTAILLPLFLVATVLPVLGSDTAPRVRQWAMRATAAPVKAPADFKMLGLSVPTAGAVPDGAQVRVSRDGRRWSRWAPVEFEAEVGPDLGSPETGSHTSMPVWTGSNRYVEVRGAPSGAKIHAIDPGPDPSVPASSAMASPSKPGIITRAGWGADESIRKGGADYASSLQLGVVHHTATADSYSKTESDDIVRGIYAYHVKTNGWDDIGYNFLVDRYGQIFEGRYGGVDRNVIGAHAQGFNAGSTGVAVIGNFASTKPPDITMSSLKRILSWKLDLAHIDPRGSTTFVSGGSNKYPKGQRVTLNRIIGHRDVGQTACPGNPLQGALGWLRGAAYTDGLPKLFEAKVSRAAITPNGDGVADGLKLTGRFSSTMSWRAEVVDSAGKAHHAVTGSGTSLGVTWYGKNSSGALVPHGAYRFKVTGTGAAGSLRSYYLPFSVYKWANGTFMYTSSKVTFILHAGVLRHPSTYQSRATRYSGDEYVKVPSTIEKYYPKTTWIGFREGSLVSYDGKVYIISEGKKRPTTKTVLANKGFNTAGIIATSATALKPHPTGTTFGSSSALPNGAALRSSGGTEGWLIGGVARHFFNRKVRESYMIRDVDFSQPADSLLAAGASSPKLGFREGTLLQVPGDSTIYMVSDGKRRPFPSASVFAKMGFKTDNVKAVTPAELALHPAGKTL